MRTTYSRATRLTLNCGLVHLKLQRESRGEIFLFGEGKVLMRLTRLPFLAGARWGRSSWCFQVRILTSEIVSALRGMASCPRRRPLEAGG